MTELPVWVPRPDEDPMQPPPPSERVSYSRTTIDRVAAILARHGGTDVPPADLPGQIKALVEAKERAEHQARTLAGEVADLTDRLDNDLPTIFDTVLDELAADIGARQVEIQADDVHEVGVAAFRLALRLITDHELRPRDAARPRRLDCGCDPSVLNLGFPGSGGVWTCPHGNRWREHDGTLRPETDAEFLADHPVIIPSAFVVHPTVDGGSDYFVPDAPVVGSDGLTAAERAVDLEPSPVLYDTGPAVRGINEIVTYDRNGTATSLWGIPLDSNHPSIRYFTETPHAPYLHFAGCDDTADCRRKILGQIVRSKLEGVEQGTRGHQTAVLAITDAIVDAMPDDAPAVDTGALRETVRSALTYSTIFPSTASRGPTL